MTVGEGIRFIHRKVDGDDLYFVASALEETRTFLCSFRVKGRRPEIWWPDTGRTDAVAVYNEQEGNTSIPLNLDPCGSAFVVFRADAAPLPDRVVSVRMNGVEVSGLGLKPAPDIQLHPGMGSVIVTPGSAGGFHIQAGEAGGYELKTFGGRTLKVNVPTLPDPYRIEGPWELDFPKGLGAPERVTLERLISWTEHSNAGVKFFSGTATYHRKFELPARMMGKDRALCLDLGRVCVIAQAKLNGHDLGILWKPPFRVDVTEVIKAGANELEVSVVNLWPNRLIGDDNLPSDVEWAQPAGFGGGGGAASRGAYLAAYPQWLLDNKPSPTGRVAFTVWRHWTKDDPLLESGLLGPVRIIARVSVG